MSTFRSPTPSNIDLGTNSIPASTSNNVRPTIEQGLLVDHATIRLLGTGFNTTSDPVIMSPLPYGTLLYVKNEQASDAQVVGSLAGDAGILIPAGTTVLLGTDGEGRVLFMGGGSASGGGSGSRLAKAVVTSALPAYTRTGGVITANAVGVPATTFDGWAVAQGDVILLQGGFAVSPSDAGPYVITQMGTAGLPLILTRPSWWANGMPIPEAAQIAIQEGTLFKNTDWKTWVIGTTILVGTGNPLLFPQRVVQSRNLVAGTFAVFNVPVRSALLTSVRATRTGSVGDVTLTLQYNATVAGVNGIVAGEVGTASVTIEATKGDATGTKNAADTSAINVVIENG